MEKTYCKPAQHKEALLHIPFITHEKELHERNSMRLLMKDYSTQLKLNSLDQCGGSVRPGIFYDQFWHARGSEVQQYSLISISILQMGHDLHHGRTSSLTH